MMDIADHEWELLNAYSDGELPAEEAAALEARLSNEPALQAALEEIRAVSTALSGLKPALATAEAPAAPDHPQAKVSGAAMPANQPWKPLWHPVASFSAVAMAAAVAGALFLAPLLEAPKAQPDLLALHAAFTAQSYTLDDAVQPARATSGLGAPDLSLASLFLVDQQALDETRRVMHYSGRNNCRLTLLASPAAVAPTRPAGPTAAQWATEQHSYTIVATGMDLRRFNAIADYLRRLTLRGDENTDVLAMVMATDTAAPCTAA
jgi:anti-sigma factor RsiW